MQIQNGRYEGTVGSDLDRDGMFLEITPPGDPSICYLEVFYSDVTHKFTITLFYKDMDLDLVEEAIIIAKSRLPLRPT